LIVLDASAYAPLLIKLREKMLEAMKKYSFVILDLTIYEVCNAFWKEHVKLHVISYDEALRACTAAWMLAKSAIVHRFEEINFTLVTKIAVEENITVYDASYIVLALTLNAPLASEDKDVLNTAPKYKVKVLRLKELLELVL